MGATLQNLPFGSGIYMLTHEATGDSYIGQATCIIGRVGTHIASIVGGTHHSDKVAACFEGNGIEHMVVRVLEECPPDQLDERERHWIAECKPSLNGNGGNGGSAAARAKRDRRSPITVIIDDERDASLLRDWAEDEDRELSAHVQRIVRLAVTQWVGSQYAQNGESPVVAELKAIRRLLEEKRTA